MLSRFQFSKLPVQSNNTSGGGIQLRIGSTSIFDFTQFQSGESRVLIVQGSFNGSEVIDLYDDRHSTQQGNFVARSSPIPNVPSPINLNFKYHKSDCHGDYTVTF